MKRLLALVLLAFSFSLSCTDPDPEFDGGVRGGGKSGTGGGLAAGGGVVAGGRAGGSGGSAGGLSAAGGTAGGSAGESDGGAADAGVTFCSEVESGATALRAVLMACPSPGDEGIYAFNPARCAAQAVANCTLNDQVTMLRVAACEKAIMPCASAADRPRVTMAIDTCVSNITVSTACLASFQ